MLKRSLTILAVALAVAFVASLTATPVTPIAADEGFELLSPDGKYWGNTYDGWAEEWHSWFMRVPADVNPMFDSTGVNCAEGQRGKVWFLTGAFGGTVERECAVPDNKALFFPVYNWLYFPFPEDEPMTDAEKAATAADIHDSVLSLSGTVTIDGAAVGDLEDYLVNSGWFKTWMPEGNWLDVFYGDYYPGEWGVGMSDPHYNDGVYLLLKPLSEGSHTIRFTHSGGLDVTYNLTVE